jgi:hypothetical protein
MALESIEHVASFRYFKKFSTISFIRNGLLQVKSLQKSKNFLAHGNELSRK